MKRIIAILCSLSMLLMLCACSGGGGSKPTPEAEPTTIGTKLLAEFNTLNTSDSTEDIAIHLAELDWLDLNGATMPVEPGFLNGFTAEIGGFSEGTMFGPLIGSIPFVGYVFRTDDADALMQSLKDSADLRWNICTEADEMVCDKNGDLVFFVMCPTDFEE